MTKVGGATVTLEAQSRNMMNICTKYGFDILKLFMVVMVDTDDTRCTTDDNRWTQDNAKGMA